MIYRDSCGPTASVKAVGHAKHQMAFEHLQIFGVCCSVEASRKIVEQTKLFKVTVSFGSVTSLISLPCYMSHASIPAEVRAARGLPDDLIRISAGIEDPEDLLSGAQATRLWACDINCVWVCLKPLARDNADCIVRAL